MDSPKSLSENTLEHPSILIQWILPYLIYNLTNDPKIKDKELNI